MSEAVTVLMCTFNGREHLSAQLDSILQQGADVQMYVSDDGSTDGTRALLDDYQARYPLLFLRSGPGKGFVHNFFGLICDPDIEGQYFALADQDDVWLPGHLERAQRLLAQVPEGMPALVASRTRLVDYRLGPLGLSPAHEWAPSFRNALVQNIASGNTMVFNAAARTLMKRVAQGRLPHWHDWMLYQVVTACGGQVFYLQEPSVLYRQHAANTLGARWHWSGRWHRIMLLLQGKLKEWAAVNSMALGLVREQMTSENQVILDQFLVARSMCLPWRRLMGLRRSGVYRQSLSGQLALYLAVIFNRL